MRFDFSSSTEISNDEIILFFLLCFLLGHPYTILIKHQKRYSCKVSTEKYKFHFATHFNEINPTFFIIKLCERSRLLLLSAFVVRSNPIKMLQNHWDIKTSSAKIQSSSIMSFDSTLIGNISHHLVIQFIQNFRLVKHDTAKIYAVWLHVAFIRHSCQAFTFR